MGSKSVFRNAVLILLALLLWPGRLTARPYDNVTADEKLYQRVRALGEQGWLDPADRAVLDRGEIVSRLELALYVEKAAARLESSESLTMAAAPAGLQPSNVLTVAAPSVPFSKREIRELLRLLSEEAAFLRSRLALQGARLAEREEELQRLRPIQDRLDAEWEKANQSTGVPSVNTKSEIRAESLGLSGIASHSALKIQEEISIGVWSDLGGKGSLYFGVGGILPLSNASSASAPVSLFTTSPSIHLVLDGPLGRWSTNFVVEAYQPDTTLGNFVRGASPTALRRYTNPVHIVNYNEDRNTKNWDDYMSQVGFLPRNYLATGNAASAGDRVFDGLYAIGTGMPLLPADARLNVMLGRMGSSSTQTQRWEKEVKWTQPLAGGKLRSSLAGTWVNDHFGIERNDALDLDNYAGDFAIIAVPVYFRMEGAISRLSAGSSWAPAIWSGGGQGSLAYYPFTLNYSEIGADYSNFQNKIMMSGVHFERYGQDLSPSRVADMYGAIGEVDNLISNRRGWRANLGWAGRQQGWMKGWPRFLDDVIVNLDAARKKEYRSETSPRGYHVVEPFNMLTFYYPDDEGLWGRHFWGGWGAGEDGAHSVRRLYMENLHAIRNDGLPGWDDTRHQFRMTSERIPLILPVPGEPVQVVDGRPVTTAPGVNTYVNLDHRKTYHYLTLTTKLRLDKLAGISRRLYGSFFYTDNRVSGTTVDPVLSATADPHRPGKTLAVIPHLFQQKVFDAGLMFQVVRNLNLMAEAGRETWRSDYTWPLVRYRTDSVGGGWAYDLPWGGGKLEVRYKHIEFTSEHVRANNYRGDQVVSTLMLLF